MPEATIISTNIDERKVSVHVSEKAKRMLGNRTLPLYVNMELYFSCFIKKMIKFSDIPPQRESSKITENLFASFRPVQSKSCNIHDLSGDNTPILIDLNVTKRKAIVPRHLFIDYKRGEWKGDFTWNLK